MKTSAMNKQLELPNSGYCNEYTQLFICQIFNVAGQQTYIGAMPYSQSYCMKYFIWIPLLFGPMIIVCKYTVKMLKHD